MKAGLIGICLFALAAGCSKEVAATKPVAEPNPKELFEKFLQERAPKAEGKRFRTKLKSGSVIRDGTARDGTTVWEDRDTELELGEFKYDIRKTDSLVSPYVAEVKTPIKRYDVGGRFNGELRFTGTLTLTYGFQDARWKLTDATKVGKYGTGKHVRDREESSPAEDRWVEAIGMKP